jgi:hypothetical protein
MATIKRYFPSLSDLFDINNIPDDSKLIFIKDAILPYLSSVFYKDLQFSKNATGSEGCYDLKIISNRILSFKIPGIDAFVVVNRDDDVNNISVIPISIKYKWDLLNFIRTAKEGEISLLVEQAFAIINEAFQISNSDIAVKCIKEYCDSYSSVDVFDQLVLSINNKYAPINSIVSAPLTSSNRIGDTIKNIEQELIQDTFKEIIFKTFILEITVEGTWRKLQRFYNSIIKEDINAYFKKLIMPKIEASLKLSASLELPRKWIVPLDNDLNPIAESVLPRAQFDFANADLYFNSEFDGGISTEFVISTPKKVMIAKTGIILNIDKLKVDLRRDRNIVEIDNDFRPSDFQGIYVQNAELYLPFKWTTTSNLKFNVNNLIFGNKGGVSGEIFLQGANREKLIEFAVSDSNVSAPLSQFNVNKQEALISVVGDDPKNFATFPYIPGQDLYIRDINNNYFKFDASGNFSKVVIPQTSIITFNINSDTSISFDSFYLRLVHNRIVTGSIAGTLTNINWDDSIKVVFDFENGFLIRAYSLTGQPLVDNNNILITLDGLTFGKSNDIWKLGLAAAFTYKKEIPAIDKLIPKSFIVHDFLIQSNGAQTIFDIEAKWKNDAFIRGNNTTGLKGYFPVNKKAPDGGFSLKGVQLNGIANPNFELEVLLVQAGLKIGPVEGAVDHVGVKAKLALDEMNANLGPYKVDISFVGPKGIYLKIEKGEVKGQGFLWAGDGKYKGGISIKFSKFNLTAIAIIDTKLPDGSKGFALMVLICATFQPIDLGFGITLNGVGGLLGLHHTFDTEYLRGGIKNGSIDNVLFPGLSTDSDNSAQLINVVNELDKIFPLQKNHFVVGPMLKLGWPTAQNFLILDVGVFIELTSAPSIIRLALIGKLSGTFPTKGVNMSIVRLNVAFIGILDFDKQYVSFDASIYDSDILKTIQLYGDMAVRVFWGNQTEMLVTVGGFHPAFSPSASLMLPKDLKRLGISLIDTDVQGIRLKLAMEMYFAITSNTVQFGAKLEMLIKYWKLEIAGLMGFDVLFHFNPFQFESHVYASLAVKYSGEELFAIGLDFLLNGPGPWYARGYAEFKLLWWTEKVNFTHTWGAAPNTIQPPADVRKLVKDALNDTNNWVAELPSTSSQLVQIREKQGTQLVIDPSGSLVVTQKVVPLGITIQKFGNTVPIDVEAYKIIDAKFGTDPQATAQVKENFAPAQFRNMSDDEKLKAASFEFLDAGIKFGCNDWRSGTFITKALSYENTIIDKDIQPSPKLTYSVDKLEAKTFIAGGKISECVLLETKNNLLVTPLIQLQQPKYKLVSADTLTAPSMVADSYNSLAEALDQKEQLIPTALQNLILCKS